jgi:hypothetical protein
MDNQRQLKSQHRWKGPARFKVFFEHNRFGFALRVAVEVSIFFFLLGFVGTVLFHLVGFLLFGAGAVQGANPLEVGLLGAAVWFPFAFAAGLTSMYKERFEKVRD